MAVLAVEEHRKPGVEHKDKIDDTEHGLEDITWFHVWNKRKVNSEPVEFSVEFEEL